MEVMMPRQLHIPSLVTDAQLQVAASRHGLHAGQRQRSNGMNKRNSQRTPLHHAAADAELETVAQLVELGVDVNAQDSQGWSALHFAAQSLSTDCARLLLEAGANVNARDSFGNTPLSRAVFAYQGDGGLIELLRKAGAEPNLKNNLGVSPVDLARSIANHDVAKFFTDVAV